MIYKLQSVLCKTFLTVFFFFNLYSLTGGSIVGDMAPYQAFAIGGLGSVRGYGEGAIGSGRSCLVANSELTFPLVRANSGVMLLGSSPICPVTV